MEKITSKNILILCMLYFCCAVIFYGYKAEALFWDKKTGYPASFVLVPHFGDGKSVGDNLNLLWNNEVKTFYLFVPDIP